MSTSVLRTLIAILCLVLIQVAGAEALTSEQATRIARWAGFPGPVLVEGSDTLNGQFGVFLGMPVIALEQPTWATDAWMTIVLLHEVGHYHQLVAGSFGTLDPIDREWQADVWGLRAACAYGIPDREFRSLWGYMVARFGDGSSLTHGQRSLRALHGLSRATDVCRPSLEAPWQASTTSTTALGVSKSG